MTGPTLRESLVIKDLIISYSESLELVSTILGLPDWNILSAKIQGERNGAASSQNNADSSGISTDDSQKLAEQAAARTAIPFASQRFDKFVGHYQLEPGILFKIYQGEARRGAAIRRR